MKALFNEADEDKSGTVDFDEYCYFIQLYKSRQNPCERLLEALMDLMTPKPAYLTDPLGPFEIKMRDAGCSAAAIAAFAHNYKMLYSCSELAISESDIVPVDNLPKLDDIEARDTLRPSRVALTPRACHRLTTAANLPACALQRLSAAAALPACMRLSRLSSRCHQHACLCAQVELDTRMSFSTHVV